MSLIHVSNKLFDYMEYPSGHFDEYIRVAVNLQQFIYSPKIEIYNIRINIFAVGEPCCRGRAMLAQMGRFDRNDTKAVDSYVSSLAALITEKKGK